MADQVVLGDLASVLQLAAGVALAMSVFRAPYERRYHRLGSILDREETILRGREDPNAVQHGDAIIAARAEWVAKGREIEPLIGRHERWIWASVVLACSGLLTVSLWAASNIPRLAAAVLVLAVIGPLLWGTTRIVVDVRNSLVTLTKRIEDL